MRRALAGDLDNIILKAINKQPSRRYPGAEQMAEDIRHYLNGRPVSAHPNAISYRAIKFLRRNALRVIAIIVVLTTLVGGAAATFWQARKAQIQRERAEFLLTDVRDLLGELSSEFSDEMVDVPNATLYRKRLAERAAARLERIAQFTAPDANLRRTLASAYEKLAEMQNNINLGENRLALATLQKALALRQALVSADPNRRADYCRGTGAILARSQIRRSSGVSLCCAT